MSNPDADSRFDEIYDSTSKAALTLITVKCGCTADIGDIFQDTYMELYKVLVKRGAGYIKNEKAFVLRIAKRKLARYYSMRKKPGVFVPMTVENDDAEEIALTDFEAGAFLSEDFADNWALVESVRQAISSKPEDVQKVFYLMYDVGLTIAEIARAMSIKESSVKNKLYRTLAQLRTLLG